MQSEETPYRERNCSSIFSRYSPQPARVSTQDQLEQTRENVGESTSGLRHSIERISSDTTIDYVEVQNDTQIGTPGHPLRWADMSGVDNDLTALPHTVNVNMSASSITGQNTRVQRLRSLFNSKKNQEEVTDLSKNGSEANRPLLRGLISKLTMGYSSKARKDRKTKPESANFVALNPTTERDDEPIQPLSSNSRSEIGFATRRQVSGTSSERTILRRHLPKRQNFLRRILHKVQREKETKSTVGRGELKRTANIRFNDFVNDNDDVRYDLIEDNIITDGME